MRRTESMHRDVISWKPQLAVGCAEGNAKRRNNAGAVPPETHRRLDLQRAM